MGFEGRRILQLFREIARAKTRGGRNARNAIFPQVNEKEAVAGKVSKRLRGLE